MGVHHLELQGDAPNEKLFAGETLTFSSSVLGLSTNRCRPAVIRSIQERISLDPKEKSGIASLARQEGVTEFAVLACGIQALIYRYNGHETIAVRSLAQSNKAVAIEADFSGNPTFRDLLARFPQLASPEDAVADDLKIEFSIQPDEWFCTLHYDGSMFEPGTMQRMLGHYRVILGAALENPGQPASRLPLLTEAERRQILVEFNSTRRDFGLSCFPQEFEDQVRKTPEAIALVCGDQRLTYSELNAGANRLAHLLRRMGVGPDVMVGLCIERSLEMITALLAVLKAGGAYVPLDPDYPKERLAFLLDDLRAPIVLCRKQSLETIGPYTENVLLVEDWPRLTAEQSIDNPRCTVSCDHVAYVLYTSGSTGKPKGVLIPHRALSNYLGWCLSAYGVEDGRGAPVHTPIGFDLTVTSLFPALLTGRCIVLIPEDPGLDALTAELRTGNFSLVKLTPAHLEALSHKLSAAASNLPGRTFVIGGEALSSSMLEYWRREFPALRLINEYGPTEATVGCCVFEVPSGPIPSGPIPIGRPIPNVALYVLDRNLQPVPAGVAGELHIGGDGLALGYHRRPELTTEKFISDPFNTAREARLYKTGDLVRFRTDGNLEFVGRLDHQVKIRGFRIELGEIELALTGHPFVREAVAATYTTPAGDRRLVAYVVLEPRSSASETDLKEFLKQRLPDYMLPASFIFLNELPLTSNAKVDRKALPPPASSDPRRSATVAKPRNELEAQLLNIWEEILPARPIGVHDDFFDVGGDSLLAIKMIARIEKAMAIKAPVGAMFHASTIERLAALLRSPEQLQPPNIFKIQPLGSRPPFYCVGAGPMFRILANALGMDQPFLGVPLPDTAVLRTPYRLEEVARYCVDSMREAQPEGPYFLGGWSDAGVLAYEMAQQLQQAGQTVGMLVLFDTDNPAFLRRLSRVEKTIARSYFLGQWLRLQFQKFRYSETGAISRQVRLGIRFRMAVLRGWMWSIRYRMNVRTDRRNESGIQSIEHVSAFVTKRYQPSIYGGRTVLFRSSERPAGRYRDPTLGWSDLIPELEIYDTPGNHMEMFLPPNVSILADRLRGCLEAVREPGAAMTAGGGPK